ncbi:MAG: hypothetical protein JXA42_15905, partial [Anaerolineales bacterium]|nr:hypothetical protein [Anaerolineales bacterium]
MSKTFSRTLVLQPGTYQAMQRGINQIVLAISPTLGPRPRLVAIDNIEKGVMPELLDNGGIIARRLIQLSDRHEDVGAMKLREVLLQLADQVGDGTATAAVLFGTVFNEGVKFLASGGNAPRLKHYLDEGYQLVLETLSKNSIKIHGQQALTQVARTVCYEEEMASMIGEIFDIIGDYGRIEIRPGNRQECEREYVEGMYWEKGLLSRQLVTEPKEIRAEFENAAILISDLEIDEPQQLFPVLEAALKNDIRRLLMVVGSLSNSSIAFLLRNKDPERLQVAAVKTPGWDEQQKAWALEDLTI